MIYKMPRYFSRFKSIGLLGQEEKRKIDSQEGEYGGHFGFPIGTNLDIFYLQVALIPTKFQVCWLIGSGDGEQNRFSKSLPWWQFFISDQNDFSFFFNPKLAR